MRFRRNLSNVDSFDPPPTADGQNPLPVDKPRGLRSFRRAVSNVDASSADPPAAEDHATLPADKPRGLRSFRRAAPVNTDASDPPAAEDHTTSLHADKPRGGLRGLVKRVLRKPVILGDVDSVPVPKRDMFQAEHSNSDVGHADGGTTTSAEQSELAEGILSRVVVSPERVFATVKRREASPPSSSSEPLKPALRTSDKKTSASPPRSYNKGVLSRVVLLSEEQRAQTTPSKALSSVAVSRSKSYDNVTDTQNDEKVSAYRDESREKALKSPDPSVDAVASVESSFYDPADEIVYDLGKAGSDFWNAITCFCTQTVSIVRVAANDVKEEQEFIEKTKENEKTFLEFVDDFVAGTLVNCSTSACSSCNPRHYSASFMEHIRPVIATPAIKAEAEEENEEKVAQSSSPPLFYLPQTPTKTYQLEAEQELTEPEGDSDSFSTASNAEGPEHPFHEDASSIGDDESSIMGANSSANGAIEEGDTLNVTVLRPTSSLPTVALSAFSRQSKDIDVSRTVSVISRHRSGDDKNDPILCRRALSVLSRKRSEDGKGAPSETEDLYRLSSDISRPEDVILPPAFRNAGESLGEERRDSRFGRTSPTLISPPSLSMSQRSSSSSDEEETVDPNQFLNKGTTAKEKASLVEI